MTYKIWVLKNLYDNIGRSSEKVKSWGGNYFLLPQIKAYFKYHLTSAMDSHTKKSHQNKPLTLNTLITHQSSSKQECTSKIPINARPKKKKTKKPKN